MYVTLEPCAHEGRQPPCVEAILEAGISRVVVGSDDPSEKASGRGPGMLRDSEVKVELAAGEEATAARLLNQPFRKHARTGLPLVTLKLAMSLDGQTTTAPGGSPWISGPESRELVHRWRAESDAIAAGIGTVLADDPLLTARPDPSGAPFVPRGSKRRTGTDVRQPVRVVFDRRARLPLDSRLLRTLDEAPVLVVASQGADPDRLAALRDAGAQTLVTDGIEAALAELGRRGVTSLFLEGGRILADAFVDADAIDEGRVFVAPILLGAESTEGEGGGVRADAASRFSPRERSRTGVSSPGEKPSARPDTPTLAPRPKVEQIGNDVLITTRFKEW